MKTEITMIENTESRSGRRGGVFTCRRVCIGRVCGGIADFWAQFPVTAEELSKIIAAADGEERWQVANAIRRTPMGHCGPAPRDGENV